MIRYELHLTTNGGFEVCVVQVWAIGGELRPMGYELRRKVETIGEAAWLMRVPLHEAKKSFVGTRP